MIPVIDLFAGPGGLNEGFSSVLNAQGSPVFRTAASFEMESSAIQTLTLRAALREVRAAADGLFPPVYYDFLNGRASEEILRTEPKIAAALERAAAGEVFQVELGEATRHESDELIEARVGTSVVGNNPWVLIGGPPCQAYSLAGRSRRTSDVLFYEDKKHFLFREYLHILERFRPTVFVMENVKGLLSSQHSGFNMFDRIREDLSLDGTYEIRSLVVDTDDPKPADFVIRSERYGVPQRRHRVILLGVATGSERRVPVLDRGTQEATLADAIGDMPPIRSQLSPRRMDSPESWAEVRQRGRKHANYGLLHSAPPPLGVDHVSCSAEQSEIDLRRWLVDPSLDHLTLHTSRAHMASDLERYEYLSLVLRRDRARPTVTDLPEALRPEHKNVSAKATPFLDRFKVQALNAPSSTVTSHIAKDGHYYIHPDPDQMRSLSVREVARLQTFPDNYWFVGSRSQRYHQVGNAVPPYLAKQIAEKVAKAVGEL